MRRLRRPLALGLAALAFGGCSLEEERPEEIPPPPTPTDQREAGRVQTAAATYVRDTRLIESEARRCGRGLAPGFFEPVCGPALRPLLAQRRTHLREGLQGLPPRVGPRCAAALRRARAARLAAAGDELRTAARTCKAEYRRAVAAG